MTYINWRGPQGRETIDQIERQDFPTWKDYRTELRRLLGEYAVAGMNAYESSRPCSGWL